MANFITSIFSLLSFVAFIYGLIGTIHLLSGSADRGDRIATLVFWLLCCCFAIIACIGGGKLI